MDRYTFKKDSKMKNATKVWRKFPSAHKSAPICIDEDVGERENVCVVENALFSSTQISPGRKNGIPRILETLHWSPVVE